MTPIAPNELLDEFSRHGLSFFAGVPDSTLQGFGSALESRIGRQRHVVAANEGNAVALAAGWYLATGRLGVVYLQNSGLGNAVNPLLSLTNRSVYRIPLLMLIGWRGAPGQPDEPQHAAQGRLTPGLLDALEIEYSVIDPTRWRDQLAAAVKAALGDEQPRALLFSPGTLGKRPSSQPGQGLMRRQEVLEALVGELGPRDIVVSTTGKTSRELFEIRQARGQSHATDFLTVGSMGHTASIALGLALGCERTVWCVDGDGSALMHLGSLAVTAQTAAANLRYILINNGAHESVGGQKTVGLEVDFPGILSGAGFQGVSLVRTRDELAPALRRLRAQTGGALVAEVAVGSRADLGRPSVTPLESRTELMALLDSDRAVP
ncbi:MAG: phosphonopyruvate decarboxylase [Bifidobacteriaceae bacterium]|jgi:phosphonopyruvate decarboxylase|nr:phosphonopyruvate decarboxylase [Bifidobacteriaceae bacterium]